MMFLPVDTKNYFSDDFPEHLQPFTITKICDNPLSKKFKAAPPTRKARAQAANKPRRVAYGERKIDAGAVDRPDSSMPANDITGSLIPFAISRGVLSGTVADDLAAGIRSGRIADAEFAALMEKFGLSTFWLSQQPQAVAIESAARMVEDLALPPKDRRYRDLVECTLRVGDEQTDTIGAR